MTVQAGLGFVREVRRDAALREQVEGLGPLATLEELVAVAAGAGFDCSAAELERAHALDWRMRWARYTARPGP